MLTPEQIGIQTDLRKAAILSNFKEFNGQAPVNETIQPADAPIEKSEKVTPLQTIENKLNDNLSKGLITDDEFKKASEQLETLKAKETKVVE